MGTVETVLLTGAIVVIDVIVLSEYLKLEEELRKVKLLAGQATSNLDSIAQQVIEQLPNTDTVRLATSPSLQSFNADAVITESSSVPVPKTDTERENEKLKAEKEALMASRNETHTAQLDEIGSKIDEITEGVKSAKEKAVQYS